MRSMQTFVVAVGIVGFATLGLMAPQALIALALFLLAAVVGVTLALGEPALALWLRWWRRPAQERVDVE